MDSKFVIGVDFGTNSARSIVVDYHDGEVIGKGVATYLHGQKGVCIDARNPNIARHHPADYPVAAQQSIRDAMNDAAHSGAFSPESVIGLGIDATASTPLPLDTKGIPLALHQKPADEDLNLLAWLWKDHSAIAEAEEITVALREYHPEVLARIGGSYSSEWFWSKALRFVRSSNRGYEATATWVEVADWFSAWLTGIRSSQSIPRNICMAGHKGLYDPNSGGAPPMDFLETLDSRLVRFADSMTGEVLRVGQVFGRLSTDRAQFLGLPAGIAIGVPAIDAHIGALGSGIRPGRMVKIMGTSGVDLVIAPENDAPSEVPGLSGVIPDSIVPGFVTIEGGQSAVGDIYGWVVDELRPGAGADHESLTSEAKRLRPGETGLLCLDWHNGNRTILIDQRLSGAIVGLNLHSRPHHIYRALIEATAFGSRIIMDRMSDYGVEVDDIVTSGGLPLRNELVMQIFADVLQRPLRIAGCDQTGALGSAISAAVAADLLAGAPVSVPATVDRMTGFLNRVYEPNPKSAPVYDELYALYCQMHDSFGTPDYDRGLYTVMKRLIEIRDRVSNSSDH